MMSFKINPSEAHESETKYSPYPPCLEDSAANSNRMMTLRRRPTPIPMKTSNFAAEYGGTPASGYDSRQTQEKMPGKFAK